MNKDMVRLFAERMEHHSRYKKWRTYFKVGRAVLQTLTFVTIGTILGAFSTHIWTVPIMLVSVLAVVIPIVLWLRKMSLRYWSTPLYDHRLFFNR